MMILVVEDESLINLVASEDLRGAGHTVISAYSADQAIAILESRNDIQLVFTDVDMPGNMDGLKLAAAVRDRWPPVQIVIASGKHPKADLPEGTPFLSKPYRIDQLLHALEAFS
jgi:CheY-like chemotaxis protein